MSTEFVLTNARLVGDAYNLDLTYSTDRSEFASLKLSVRFSHSSVTTEEEENFLFVTIVELKLYSAAPVEVLLQNRPTGMWCKNFF